jgi:PTH1 family peptidyl-tRNA hydrolase
MNLSGQSISKVIQFYDIALENILVFVDDIYLDIGTLRLRDKGGHGGQNGLKNIIIHLHSQDFKRVRFGIGENKNIPLDQYVLSNFSKSEEKKVEEKIIACLEIIEAFVQNLPFVDIMTKHNKKK